MTTPKAPPTPSRPPTDSEEALRAALGDIATACEDKDLRYFGRNRPEVALKIIDYIHTAARAALGEARGTASASESPTTDRLRKRAGSWDGSTGGDASMVAASSTDVSASESLDYDPITVPIPEGDWNGPHGPAPSPPAPDLLRENARLREEVAENEERLVTANNAIEDAAALQDELTRARAAHLENAELLAKANAANTPLRKAAGLAIKALHGAGLLCIDEASRYDDSDRAGKKYAARMREAGKACATAAGALTIALEKQAPVTGTPSADRKGDAAQPPTAAPAKGGGVDG